MKEAVKEEVDQLELEGMIQKAKEPTEWCAPIMPVQKPSGDNRICVDLAHLNKFLRRERHQLPTVEEIMGSFQEARVFSKLDASFEFYQIHLLKSCQKLTTFITPYGRYCYQRLPFGVTSAPEIFQQKFTEVLEGLEGVLNYMDDVLEYGANKV